ncbi:peptidoglycan-binding protein, partial [Candidatus Pseudothioglobus singularis]|nr:peptidoglycan-binding protein [Candidatus Pseudothioglobus singularis]
HVSFDGIKETTYFGNWTKTRVKQFQDYYGLNTNGKLDAATIKKLEEVYNSPFQYGKRHKDIPAFKEKLNALGYDGISLTTYFGSWSDKRLRQFQKDYGLRVNGIGDSVTLAKLNGLLDPKVIKNYTYYDITLAEALAMQMRAKPQTDKKYAYVSKNYVENNKVTATKLNVRSGPCSCDGVLGQLTKGTTVNILGEYNGWYQIEYNKYAWKDAVPSDVLYYLDPTNFVNDEKLRFQFLDLSKPSNTTASVLNKYLKDKGTLEGMGQAFIDASKKHGVNDLYLLSHALLETGHGKSELAQGIEVNGKTVYNMFGIGAYDNCAVECGAERAYEEGWFTPYDAIVGGAKFIGNGYIKAGQNTLYKMRWNPEGMEQYGYATHQYATDIGWAAKQVTNMYNMYKDIGIYHLILDIPRYKA